MPTANAPHSRRPWRLFPWFLEILGLSVVILGFIGLIVGVIASLGRESIAAVGEPGNAFPGDPFTPPGDPSIPPPGEPPRDSMADHLAACARQMDSRQLGQVAYPPSLTVPMSQEAAYEASLDIRAGAAEKPAPNSDTQVEPSKFSAAWEPVSHRSTTASLSKMRGNGSTVSSAPPVSSNGRGAFEPQRL
jgi:hypothetical protein